MKKYIIIPVLAAIALSIALVQCKKAPLGLNGSASTADFTFQVLPLQDTLPYAYVVRFTNTSEEAVQYQWDFGDNTALSAEKNPTHKYAVGGEYIVKLISVGTNGNNTISKRIFVTNACQEDFFNTLTGCNNFVWTWSTDADAIRVLSPDGLQLFFAGSAANCQVDDQYKFYADGRMEYDANGQTFDVQAGYSCQAPRVNAKNFKVVRRAGSSPEIVLDNVAGGPNPFIGTTDVVDNNRYEVVSYTSDKMTLRGRIAGTGGQRLEIKLKKVVALTLADIKNLLTGGSSKGWKLDATPGANAIIVGTEANPAQYFGGGAIDGCQADDVYTFTAADKVIYNANGATFNGGNIAPNYNCGADRSYSNITYTFGATTGGVAGLATMQLPSSPPAIFIGTTDVPDNTYRIIEISATKMVLRAGNGSGTVFQFKFIAQ
jgi:PKD repeat protein